MNKRNAPLALVLVAALWGSSYVATKICVSSGMYTFETLLFRLSLSSVLIWIAFRKNLHNFTRTAVRSGVLMGIVTAANYALEINGLARVPASKAGFLVATSTVMFSFLHSAVHRTRPQFSVIIAAVLSTIGVGVLGLNSGQMGRISIGDVLLLLSAAVCAVRNLLIADMKETDSRIQITFLQLSVAAVLLAPAAFVQGFSGAYTKECVAAILYVAIFPTVFCHIIKNTAMKFVNPVLCTLILATESIFCALVSVMLMKDPVTWQLLVGSAMIISAIVLKVLAPMWAEKAENQKRNRF